MKSTLFLCLLVTCSPAFAQTTGSLIKYSNPGSAPKGYSQSVSVDLGTCNMVMMAGQVPVDSTGTLVGKENMRQQTEQVFANLEKIIKSHGGTMNDLARIQIFVTDLSQIQQLREVRERYVNLRTPPVSTIVQVSKLFRDDVLIEIEGTAVIGKASR
ncbi:RidA family protein [Flavitalea sp.]|nr:RidA family protein [Flavitalea sp.]